MKLLVGQRFRDVEQTTCGPGLVLTGSVDEIEGGHEQQNTR